MHISGLFLCGALAQKWRIKKAGVLTERNLLDLLSICFFGLLQCKQRTADGPLAHWALFLILLTLLSRLSDVQICLIQADFEQLKFKVFREIEIPCPLDIVGKKCLPIKKKVLKS